MDYVMVPVPEEHADEVQQHLRWKTAMPSGVEYDATSIRSVFKAADEQSRTLLRITAQASREGNPPTVSTLARKMGCSDREVAGLIVEVNQRIVDGGGPPASLLVVREGEARPDSAFSWSERVVRMWPASADLVLGPEAG